MNLQNSVIRRQAALSYLCAAIVLASLLLSACAGEPPSAPNPSAQPTLAAPTTGAATLQPQATPQPRPAASLPTGTAAPALANVDFLALKTLARGYLTTPNELRRTAALARSGSEPYEIAVKRELDYAEKALDERDLEVPDTLKFSDDIDKPAYLSVGSKYVYAWAIAYNLLRDSDPAQAEIYAERARTLIMGMPERDIQVSSYLRNTRLNIAVFIENFVYAADLLADWTPYGQDKPFGESADAQTLKKWLGAVIVRYPYNAAHTRVNNWSAWGRLSTAVIADYVGDAAPLYVQGVFKDQSDAYQVDPDHPCDSGDIASCVQVDARTMYADALQLHLDMVDGKLNEFSLSSCDGSGSKSMIRPDGGIPDELRRQYTCDATRIEDPYGAAARYSQFAVEAMTSLAEIAWRRGDPSLYTHIDPATGRGAIYRSVQFLIDNNVTLTRGSMLEMLNRFYSYQVGVEQDSAKRAEFAKLLSHDLPGILKRQDDWPEGTGFVSFGTLTHGFAAGETLRSPPTVAVR